MRKYGFNESDILFGQDGNLSLDCDPKETWAKNHPETFPVNINSADKYQLLRVPGLGPVTVNRILNLRRQNRLSSIYDIGKIGARLEKAGKYLTF